MDEKIKERRKQERMKVVVMWDMYTCIKRERKRGRETGIGRD